jgi:hypothetical protein
MLRNVYGQPSKGFDRRPFEKNEKLAVPQFI